MSAVPDIASSLQLHILRRQTRNGFNKSKSARRQQRQQQEKHLPDLSTTKSTTQQKIMTPSPNSTLAPPSLPPLPTTGRDGDGDGARQSSSNIPNSPQFLHCTKRLDSRFSFFHHSSSSGIQTQRPEGPSCDDDKEEAVDIENIHVTVSKEDWYNVSSTRRWMLIGPPFVSVEYSKRCFTSHFSTLSFNNYHNM